jgi:PAS domain S-box-containing protein
VYLALDGTLLYANPAFLRLVQLDPASLLTEHCFQDFLTRGGAIFYETQFAPTLLMRGLLNEISMDLVRKDTHRIPVLLNAVVSRDLNTRPVGISVAIFEAVQRKEYENELLRSRRELEQIAEVVRRSADGIISLTPDGVIQSWNNGAENIFGFSSSEAIERPLLSLFGEEGQADLRQAIHQLEDGAEINRDMTGLRKDGAAIELSICLTPHLEAPGTLVAFSAVIRNITVRKQTERALLQNEKLASVGRLASSIAHEINNPLEAVTNLLYILESCVSGEEARALVATAQEELARVSYVATHTLKFHKQSSNRTVTDIAALADSVLGLYRARLQNAGIEAVNDCTGTSPLYCFEGELRQVLVNVVSNAFDAMRNGGRLVFRSRNVTRWSSCDKGIRITVADTGTGMDAVTLSRLFEAFFSTKGIGGTGLGMWITKELIEKNGGVIKVRSSTDPASSGTVVSMFFPHRNEDRK